jgi:hypothetical protein
VSIDVTVIGCPEGVAAEVAQWAAAEIARLVGQGWGVGEGAKGRGCRAGGGLEVLGESRGER